MEKPVKSIAISVSSQTNRMLWSLSPIIRKERRVPYYGRVTVECWTDGERLISGDESLLSKAVSALSSPDTEVVRIDALLAPEGATGPNDKQTFTGHVVVEIWADQALIGVTGDGNALLPRAKKAISGVISAVVLS